MGNSSVPNSNLVPTKALSVGTDSRSRVRSRVYKQNKTKRSRNNQIPTQGAGISHATSASGRRARPLAARAVLVLVRPHLTASDALANSQLENGYAEFKGGADVCTTLSLMPIRDPERRRIADRDRKRRSRLAAGRAKMDTAKVDGVLPDPPGEDELLKLAGVLARNGSITATKLLLARHDQQQAGMPVSGSVIADLAARRSRRINT